MNDIDELAPVLGMCIQLNCLNQLSGELPD